MAPKKRPRAAVTLEAGKKCMMPFITKQQFFVYGEKPADRKDAQKIVMAKKLVRKLKTLSASPFKKSFLKQVLLSCHAEKLATEGGAWKLPDAKAESWAEHMARRLMLLRKHVKTGEKQKPQWYRMLQLSGSDESDDDSQAANAKKKELAVEAVKAVTAVKAE